MYKFSNRSLEKLSECGELLQILAKEVIKRSETDFGIICGKRSNEEQLKKFNLGLSKAKPGQSGHNYNPSRALDFGIYVKGVYQNGDTKEELVLYKKVNDLFHVVALEFNIKIKKGISWDLGHIELA